MKKKDSNSSIYLHSNHLTNPTQAQEKITAVFEFNQNGYLKTVFLNSSNDRDQIILQKGIERLTKPYHFGWLRRLFR